MLPDPRDTIVAPASAAGPGGRGIVRLSGKDAFAIARTLGFDPPAARRIVACDVRLEGLHAPLPCAGYFFPGPRSHTGEDVVEMHMIGSPPLIDLLAGACLSAGARAAQPGEFTLRAFRAGKLDLTQAEAVLAVIEAGTPSELKSALGQLAGGMARPIDRLRGELLDLRADVEASLDFADDEVPGLPEDQLLHRLAGALAQTIAIQRQVHRDALADRRFRAVLAGPANVGKSSLFNALLGRPAALVSPQPGTTRDYIEATVDVDGAAICLVDTAGDQAPLDAVDAQAQWLGQGQRRAADLVLWCREAGTEAAQEALPQDSAGPTEHLLILTKADRAGGDGPGLVTSAATGAGIAPLRLELARRAKTQARTALSTSLARCRCHLDACLAALRRAHAIVLEKDPPELLALELRSALDELGAMSGAVFTEDLLDRIFSRFCIGK